MKHASLSIAPLEQAQLWLEQGHQVALVTIISTWSASPQPVGSMMALRQDGIYSGLVANGCVEMEIVEKACSLMPIEEPLTLDLKVAHSKARAAGMACGGELQIYLEQITA